MRPSMRPTDQCVDASYARAVQASEPIRHRFFVYSSCTLLALIINFDLGKDMAWDTLNYHMYAGFSAIHDRFGLDYFAAGPQSYFNPYIYIPFFLLAKSGAPALVVSSIFVVLHSPVLWLTCELANLLAPSE